MFHDLRKKIHYTKIIIKDYDWKLWVAMCVILIIFVTMYNILHV